MYFLILLEEGNGNPLQYSCLENFMATHSSILAWRISWTEEPGRLVHGVADEEGNGNPLQYSCLQNFMDRGAWWVSPWGCRVGHD